MHVLLTLFAIITLLVWLGFTVRPRDRGAAGVLFGFAGLLAVLLLLAFLGVF